MYDEISIEDLVGAIVSGDEELTHHGVLGMRWGIRKQRTSKGHSKTPSKSSEREKLPGHIKTGKNKRNVRQPRELTGRSRIIRNQKGNSLKKLSDEDLRKTIKRLEEEKKYRELSESSMHKLFREVGTNVAKKTVSKVIDKKLSQMLNVPVEKVRIKK